MVAPDEAAAAGDALFQSAIARRVFPAAVAEVGDPVRPLWSGAYGTLAFDAGAPHASRATVFDLASLTKPIATTTVVLDLWTRGVLQLEDRVSIYAPEWVGRDREHVTLTHLLEHASGLSARLLDTPPGGPREFAHEICTMPLEYAPGGRSLYSDLGFILLGFCAERAGGSPLVNQTVALLDRAIDAVRDVGDSAWLGVQVPARRESIAPTRPLAEDPRRGRLLTGEVHDTYAAALGGFAGHAGLFGTAAGVGTFARAVLRAARGETTLPVPLTAAVVARATRRSRVPGSSRALGWDTMVPTSSCGTRLSPEAFGHVGFTGTSLWIDPPRSRYYVLLTNRVCDGGTTEAMQHIRRTFHDTFADL